MQLPYGKLNIFALRFSLNYKTKHVAISVAFALSGMSCKVQFKAKEAKTGMHQLRVWKCPKKM